VRGGRRARALLPGLPAATAGVIARRGSAWFSTAFGNAPATRVSNERRDAVDQRWEQPWGEQRIIRDSHNALTVTLSGSESALTEPFDVTVRVFDDGFGFRYEFNQVPAVRDVAITDELTEFKLVDDLDAWWYPARGRERDEYLYHRGPLFEIDLAETPLTLQSPGLFLSIHEAALVDYASMNLKRTAERTLKADLMPWSDGVRVRKRGPFVTPWRTVLIGETPMALADSRLELNLNEPNKLADTSWIRLGKYVGIWWEMHLNKSTWGSGARTRRQQCQRETLRRLRRETRLRRCAGGRLEHRLGWRLDREWQALQLHAVVSGFRPVDACSLCARARRAAHRPPRDRGAPSRTTRASSRPR
jgi:hypothetical protein